MYAQNALNHLKSHFNPTCFFTNYGPPLPTSSLTKVLVKNWEYIILKKYFFLPISYKICFMTRRSFLSFFLFFCFFPYLRPKVAWLAGVRRGLENSILFFVFLLNPSLTNPLTKEPRPRARDLR